MNLNLSINAENDGFGRMVPPTLTDMLATHERIMKGAGFELTGPAVLIPEGKDYPGSYQVWWPVNHHSTVPVWVYIGTDGVADFRASLPSALAVSAG